MDLSAITSLSGLSTTSGMNSINNISTLTGSLTKVNNDRDSVDGTMFDSILNSAIDNIKTTNSYLSDAENEEIKFALGETENTHDLTIALQKASTALQYTVAVRNKLLEAYKELMQMQI
ncbi:MAG: flagellar hook-basal body complex protein FliE [Lachnospiraceae bacterium]|nr:flagellar hook-basal body complex protein FliE [Lachnospiraceae bacterium]